MTSNIFIQYLDFMNKKAKSIFLLLEVRNVPPDAIKVRNDIS